MPSGRRANIWTVCAIWGRAPTGWRDPAWRRYGFLPFGRRPSDAGRLLEGLEELEEEGDGWPGACAEMQDAAPASWGAGAETAQDLPLRAWGAGAENTQDLPLRSWGGRIENTDAAPPCFWGAGGEEEDGRPEDAIEPPDMPAGAWGVEIPYWRIAAAMGKCVERIRYGHSDAEKRQAADLLKAYLARCVMDGNLKDLTKIYRDLPENNVIGYHSPLVARFVQRMAARYPPWPRGPEPEEKKPFDAWDGRHRVALAELAVRMVKQAVTPPDGVEIVPSGSEQELRAGGKTICICWCQDEGDEDGYYCTVIRDFRLLSELVNGTPGLVALVLQQLAAGDP